MTTLEDEKEEPELLIPPSWDEVEADEEYQALSPMKKQVVLSNWTQAVNNYAKATGEYEADPEAGRAVADFVKRKTSEFSQNFDAAVESGLYEDNLWGSAKRLGDRAALGAMQVAPNAIALANRAAELTVQAPELMTGLLDSVGLNKLSPIDSVRENGITQAYRDFSAPLRETFRQSADAARAETNEMAAAGAAIGGGFAGEVVQAVVPAAAEAVQDMAVAIGSGGSSVPRTLAKPFEAAIRSLNVSSILGGVRSALPTLDAAEAQYMQEDPTLTREQARMKAFPEALTSGASTALVTRLGGFTGIESVLVQGGPKALRGRVLEVLKQAASEGLEEATDQSLQDLSERFYRNPEKAWADTYKELAMAYTLGSVLGGGFSAVSQTMSAVAENAKANDAPQTAAVLRQRAEREAAIRTAKLFGDENAAKEAEDLEKEILGELESEDGMDDTNEDGAPAGDGNVSGATGVISGDTTSTGTEGQTTTPAPTLRESVIASGIPEDAADAYISNLRAEGLADEQIQEIADNTRALREEAAKKNEADAEARREVARRARAGDPEARAQLERERGINVTAPEPTAPTPEPEPQSQEPGRQFVDLGGPAPQFQGGTNLLTGQPETPALLAPEVSPQQPPTTTTTTEGGEFNEEIQLRNQEGRQGRTEILNDPPTDSGAGAEGDVATPPPTEAPAPLSKLQAKRNADPEDFDNSDPETQLSDLPANEAIDLLRQVGSTYEAPPVEGDETFGDYLQRTGVSVYDFDNRPTVLNEQERRYVPQGSDPFQGLIDLAAGRATPADFTVAQAPVSDITPEEAERRRKAQEAEDFYRRNQQQTPEPEAPERPQITPQQIVQAPVKMAGDKGAVSNKRLPVREVPTGEVDKRGAPVVRVVPGFVNDSNTMAEVLDKNQGVERVYVSAEEVANLDPEDIFVQYDENGAYVVAARHTKYGVIYADTGLTEDGVSLAALHEPTRQKNSQAQIQGKRAKRLAKEAGVSVDEVAIPEMTDKFLERVSRAPVSKEEREKPQEVARMLQRIQDRALALSGETVTTKDGRTVTIDAELADRIGIAATNLYLARLRGVDRKGKFKDAGGVVADIKKKVVAKLQKRAGTRAGFSLDQAVGDGDTTMGDLVGQTDQNLDSMGYADVPLNETDERGLENLATTEAGPQQDPNTQAAQADTPTPGPTTRSGAAVQTGPVTREEIPSYDDVATQATSEAEAELQAQDAEKGTKYFEVWKETLAMMQRGVKKKDLTPTRQRVVKDMEGKIRERMRDLISARTYEPDTDKAKSKLGAESKALTSDEQKTLIRTNLDKLIDWNGGPSQSGFDIKRVMLGIANDEKQPQLVRIFAKFLANSNVDFSGVRFEALASLQKDKNWAGLYTSGDTARTGTIQINVGTSHRGDIGQTVVHEALHHVAFHKLRPSYNRTGVEREAYRDLTKILTHIRRQVLEPEPGRTLSQTARKMFSRGDDMFYGLSDLDELFTETLTNTRFAVWMSTQAPLPDIQLKNTNIFRNLYEQVKQLFKNLIGGQNVRPDSLLSQAMDNILALAQDPQDDAKIRDYQQRAPQEAKKVAASLNAAAVESPLGFQFKTQQAIRGMLNPNKRGELKGLTASPDGTVPWENLRAKITKAFSAEEADMVLPALESMVRQGRVNVAAAGEALQTIVDAKARITVLSAENAETDQTRSGIIHQLDSMYPGWEQDEAQYIEDPIFMGLRDELDSMDRGKIQETESATARFKQVNPKPLDEMDEAGDIVVEDSGKKVFGEAMHFPTRKNVIGFGRKYTETLPNGENATFVFEVQSDWASTVRKADDKMREGQGEEFEEDWEGNVRNPKRDIERASPLLSVYENLVLKAAIQDALAKGQTKLILTDAETAMMTEQHDRYATLESISGSKDQIIQKVKERGLPWDVVYSDPNDWGGLTDPSIGFVSWEDPAVRFPLTSKDGVTWVLGDPNMTVRLTQAEIELAKSVLPKIGLPIKMSISQEPGMRAAYDPANGRLHNIMRKMTGDRGQRVDLGRHQNAKRAVSIPSEVVNRLRAEGLTDQEIQDRANEESVNGSPVFKNPDGTPKTNITGIVYDLTPILENQEKVRALFAAPVNPSATPNPRAAKVDTMVQEEIPALGGTNVRSANLNGHPAQARLGQDGQPEIVYDPLAIATEVEGLDDSEARTVIRKLLGHEQAHVAGLLNDYGTADAQGRTGREKIEAFHDEVMTPEMRQDVADSYVRRLDGMTDEDYAQAKAEFLADKAAVVGEFKRMFLERHLTGESYEDSLAALERKTGNKFGDLVRAIADYLVGRIRMLQTRFAMTKDPRLAAEILADRRMLENLNSGTNGLVGDRVAGVLSAAAVTPRQSARWNELTADLQGRDLTQADLDAWKKANPEKYAELEKMREGALKAAGYTTKGMHYTTAPESRLPITKFKEWGGMKGVLGGKLMPIWFTDSYDYIEGLFSKSEFTKRPNRNWKQRDKRLSEYLINSGRNLDITGLGVKATGDEMESFFKSKGLTTDNRFASKNTQPVYTFMRNFSGRKLLYENGYDSATMTEEIVGSDKTATTFFVYDSERIKSAEPLNLENGRLVPPTEWAQPENPDIRFASRAQIRRMKKTSAGWKASGWLGQGLWDMEVWNRMKQKDAEISGANYRVEETAKKFNRLVKKHNPNAQLLRDALGTTENRLTDAQYDQWQKLKRAAQKETDPVKRQAALAAADNFRITQVRTNVANFKATQQNALNQLPQELRDTVKAMRRDIDKLSQTMLSKGMVGANLQTTIGDNLEVYLNRSYEVFDNPEWSDFILSDQSPESQRIRNNAARLFRSQLVAEEARRIRRNAKLNNQPVPTRQQALAAAQATVTPNEVSILMQDYLRVGDDAAVAILGGRLPGKKDTSILKLRGQIPQEIRELWGEYKDSGVNYAKSYLKMARFIANHNFQTDFLDMGLNRATPFLWKDGVSQGQRPPHWVEIYKGMNDSPNPNPMAGVYGPPIIAEAFKELQQTYKSNLPMQWVAGLTGMAMASKTIYNPPQTYVRNFLGNGFIMTSQGYLTKDLDQLGFFKRFGGSMATTGGRLVGIQRERSDQVVDYIERMISLGIMGDNVKANVIKELTSVIFDRDPKNAFNEKLASAFRLGKAVNDRLVDAYSAGDDFWKILAFESERSTFAQAYPNATPEALDRMAADRVRDVVPTYSKIPKFVADIVKKQPYLAPYISWTSEIIRTTLNTYRHGVQDVRSGNPVLMKSGAVRLLSATATHALLLTVGGTLRNMFGLDEEDETALRRFLPDWQVDALLVLTGKNEGKISFWDFSYLNPFDVITEPFIAMGREAEQGGNAWDVAAKGVEKAMAPWTGEQLLFGAFLDVARGYTKEGIPLYNDADSFYNNAKKGADRLIGSLTPGAINLASRIYKSLQGEVSPSGKVYKLEDEIKGAAFGQRPAEIDVVQVFQNRKVGAFNRMMESASDLATKEFRVKGTADLAKIKENYIQSNDARLKAFKELRKDMDALEKIGVSKAQIFSALQLKGVSKADIDQIAAGKYVRRFPGNTAIENAINLKLPNFPARIQALRDARDSYPEVQDFLGDE